jgi:hypothetical protein
LDTSYSGFRIKIKITVMLTAKIAVPQKKTIDGPAVSHHLRH